MTISEWLDQKEAEGKNVSHIVLPDDLANEEDPDETIFFRETRTCRIFSAPAAILFLPSSDSETGIIAEAATKRRVLTRHSRSGGCSQRIKTWRLRRLSHI